MFFIVILIYLKIPDLSLIYLHHTCAVFSPYQKHNKVDIKKPILSYYFISLTNFKNITNHFTLYNFWREVLIG